jgi:hypothetical protein
VVSAEIFSLIKLGRVPDFTPFNISAPLQKVTLSLIPTRTLSQSIVSRDLQVPF